MTVSNTTVKVSYNGNGSTRTFSVPFPILSAAHLQLIVTDSDGTETSITTGYTLNDDLDAVTYPTTESGLDPLPSGKKLTLVRQTPNTQELDLHAATTLDAERLEAAYDKLTLLVQELGEKVARAIKSRVSSTANTSAEDYLDTINEAVATAEAANEDAQTYASAAATSASQALASANTATQKATAANTAAAAAEGYASNASSYKSDASTYATLAQGYATDADNAKTDAVSAKNAAAASANDAASYASAAGLSASSAATAADNASAAQGAAEDAQAEAEAAQTAAETAQGLAEDAQTAAETAQGAAETAAAGCDSKVETHNESTTAHADIRTLIAGKQDTLTAGDNIQIVNNVISATGGGGGGGSANWGSIGGTLSNQTDLQNALDGKATASHTHTKSQITDFPAIPTVPTKLSDFTDDLGSSPTHTHSQYLESVSWNDVSSKPSSFTPSSHTHTKSEITDFPAIPAKVSDLQNDSGFITGVAWDDVSNKPSTFTPSTHTHSQYLTAVPTATTSTLGGVKPDGTTITVQSDGTISAAGGSSSGITATYDSTNKILTLE